MNRFAGAEAFQAAGWMPMTVLVCLCGAPLWRGLGGIRGGRTPNVEIDTWVESLQKTISCLTEPRAPVGAAGGAAEFTSRAELQALAAAVKRLESQVGRVLTREKNGGKGGRPWSLPQREPATKGRDQLVVALQRCGYSFREARRLVKVVWELIGRALWRGELVETPLGTFQAVSSPPERERVRFGRRQVLFRGGRRIVFRPKEL